MDIYDGADWTEMDIDEFLRRSDSVDYVARKCAELGLKPKPKS